MRWRSNPAVLGAVHASAHGLHRRLLRQDDHHHAADEFGGGFEQRWGRSLLGSSDDADKLSKGSDTHIAFYVIIPFVSAVVGYVTNVVALQMTFYPLEFTPSQLKFAQLEGQPFGLLGGWQGIIPAKAGKMAAILCDLMTTKLLDVKEMFGKIVPVEFAEAESLLLHYPWLGVHVALTLVGHVGFTLAFCGAVIYLWQAR